MTTGSKLALALVIGSGGALLAGPSAPAQEKAPENVSALLEGRYTVVSGQKDGKAVPEERIKGSVVVFTGDTIVGTDKDKKEFFASKYTLDTTKTPWTIKMKSTTPKEAEAVGLIKKEGDTITIVYSLPGADAPTEFKTRDKQHLFVLKGMPKEPVKKNP